MGFLKNMFGNKDKEKIEYIDKLIPYKIWITNFDEIVNQLKEFDLDVVKHNVDKIINKFEFQNSLEKKYGDEIGKKLYEEGVFMGMTEEQFDDCMNY
ncbi:MAG: hypothetical protein P8I93_01165, partial [Crocinitomicaceae bacterium]|nr:hypothetical protein [Crocinitomicaceae bacterium]